MSSVGSSDSSNRQQDEAVRRNREDYRKNESDMVKRHQRELRRINEQHYAELERLKSEHAKQIEQLQRQSKDAISERDYRYQQEAEDMRAMYRRQLSGLAEDSQKREDLYKKTFAADKEQNKAKNDARFEKLNHDYIDALREKDRMYRDNLKANAEAQERALDSNRDRQADYHQREMDSVKAERNSKVTDLERQYKDYREDSERRLKNQEVKHMQDNQRASNNLVRAVKKERALRLESEEILRDGFSDGLQDTRERFEKAMQRERAEADAMNRHMKSSVVDRVENQVRRLENEKEDLKEAKIRNELQMKQKQNRELGNMRDAFQRNVENLQSQRDEAIRQSNERNRNDVMDVRDELGKQMVTTNRFYREQAETNNRIHRNAYENLRDDFTTRNEQAKTIADERVRKIYESTEEQKSRMIEKQANDHKAHQEIKHDEMKKLRAVLDDDKNAAVRRMQDQIRKQELQHTERMNQAVAKYEKQLTTLKDQMMRERKMAEDNLKRTVEEMQRAHKVALDQVEAKNRDQMRQTSMVHSEQVKSLNKRHEEKLDQLITEVKKG